jgi:5-methylcytosine-specific restriction enzyme A
VPLTTLSLAVRRWLLPPAPAKTHTILLMRSPAWIWDELMLACALVVENGWRELRENDERVHELSRLLRSLPLHGDSANENPKFRSAGSVSAKTANLATAHHAYAGVSTRGGKLDKVVVDAFDARPSEMRENAALVRESFTSGDLHDAPEYLDELQEGGFTSLEGRLITRMRIARERDPRIRRRKLERVRQLGLPLQCEVCDFHFQDFYGQLGEGYIEVHHVLPLHVSGLRETSLDDLALLCANCHRMCHRARTGESWRTPAALRAEICKVPRSLTASS